MLSIIYTKYLENRNRSVARNIWVIILFGQDVPKFYSFFTANLKMKSNRKRIRNNNKMILAVVKDI